MSEANNMTTKMANDGKCQRNLLRFVISKPAKSIYKLHHHHHQQHDISAAE